MEHSLPVWLDEHFLSSCLKGDTGAPGVIIISYHVSPGVAAGNNYGSDILRCTVKYKTERDSSVEKSVSLIIKSPVNTVITEFMNETFGLAEYHFYYTFIPKARNISPAQIAPESYLTPLKSIVVLEDLKETGFSMVDRFKQLDFDHCKQYFIVSAKLHAIGVALGKQYPELFTVFPSEEEKWKKFQTQGTFMMHTMITGLKCLVKAIEGLNVDEYKIYTECLTKLTNNSGTILKAAIQDQFHSQNNHFKSFVHGDCWTTNMLFKHDASGDPIDIRLIDFQTFNYDDVVSDIINFTWMSANNEVLENRLEELYNIYCDTLNCTLVELGYSERLTLQQLKKEILEKSLHVLLMVGVFLPLTQAEQEIDEGTVFSGKSTEDEIMIYYQGKHFWNKFPFILKVVAREGVFEQIGKRFSEWK